MVDCLPVELLAHIFALATHGEEDNTFTRYSLNRPTFDTTSVRVPVVVSLCITLEMIMEDWNGQSYLDNSFLNLYLSRSQVYPVDILIDARDPSWSFGDAEPDNPFHCAAGVYWPPFSPQHMLDVMNSLLPHIHRWRSLEILTDVWAPMFIALDSINPFLMSQSAPRLEYLALSRCNEFASFSPNFYPQSMRDRPLLSLDDRITPAQPLSHLLPSLRHLKLQGVHVEWSMLGQILSQRTNASLTSLELDFHSRDIRPTLEEFHQILASSSQLETLSISGSGPVVTDLDDDDDVTLVHHDCRPVSLPFLRNLNLGYHDVSECQTVLELLDAPNTESFILEDGTYKAQPEVVDADPILVYLGTGQFNDFEAKRSSSTRPAFPALTSLSMSSVRARKRSLNTFLNSLSNLQNLSVNSMDLQEVIDSLLPSLLNTTDNSILCPCPRLEHLSLRNVESDYALEYPFIVSRLNSARQINGSVRLTCDVQQLRLEDDDEDMDVDLDSAEDVEFSSGGVFNDPYFDHFNTTATLQYLR
ncbi:hypothetical protein AN958_00372 [Leucoagaricus sp. SymC.cos]|nr:hypothetical protein AN958_00372 [Leucoagaricus sp. SymC.cos]